MKKLFLAFIVSVTAMQCAQARIVNSRIFGEREKQGTEWIFRMGMSLDNAAGSAVSQAKEEFEEWKADEAEYGLNPSYGFGCKAGFEFSLAFNKPIGKSGLYWGMELGIGTRGAKYSTNSDMDEYREDARKSLLTWNVKYSPFTIGYKYPLTKNIRLDAHLGAFASYDFAGKGHSKWIYDDGEGDNETTVIGDGDLSHFQRFDAGIQAGVGIWYKCFNFDITYQRGFINAYDMSYQSFWDIKDDAKVFSSNLMLRVGIAF